MFRDVGTEKKSIFQEAGTFNTIFLFDVLEQDSIFWRAVYNIQFAFLR